MRNTFPSGVNRELASDYHPFVAELGFAGRGRGRGKRAPAEPGCGWKRLAAMADSAAALLDERMRPPRQGDSDEGRALLLDPPAPKPGPRCWPWLARWSARSTGGRGLTADASSVFVGALECQESRRGQARPAAFTFR